MMKKALVIYYSQTGQLAEIVTSITSELKNTEEFKLINEEIRPKNPYPFPWTGKQFFQAFPESVQGIPCELNPVTCNPDEQYDLIILAYQIWYLSPSIPVNSFLQTDEAKKIINGKPVITVIGSRNMWVMAHERISKMIEGIGGQHVGNIVLTDKAPNLISVVTIIRWLVGGRREGRGIYKKIFPRAGVSEEDINSSSRFGPIILKAIRDNNVYQLQKDLVNAGAVEIKPVLISIEKRGYMMFKIWSKIILKKGAYGDPKRDPMLSLFKYYLFTVIFLISPIAAVIFSFIHSINRKGTRKTIRYYSGITK